MTPELRTACELVFQAHKASGEAINWNKDSFRGRLSFGLSALAKQTLEKRNIICTPNPSKKNITILNPLASAADSFEEAEEMIQNKTSLLVKDKVDDKPEYIAYHVPGTANSHSDKKQRLKKNPRQPTIGWPAINSPVRSMLYYIIFVLAAATAGVLITYLLGLLV